jgi:hypothetical protein
MLREWVDRDQRLKRLREHPILGELVRMQTSPLADEPQRATTARATRFGAMRE